MKKKLWTGFCVLVLTAEYLLCLFAFDLVTPVGGSPETTLQDIAGLVLTGALMFATSRLLRRVGKRLHPGKERPMTLREEFEAAVKVARKQHEKNPKALESLEFFEKDCLETIARLEAGEVGGHGDFQEEGSRYVRSVMKMLPALGQAHVGSSAMNH